MKLSEKIIELRKANGMMQEVYEGALIKESVTDDTIIDLMNVHKIELWNTGGKPK